MGADQNFDWGKTAASTLDWWRDAGVDTIVEDEPRDWLVAGAPAGALRPAGMVASTIAKASVAPLPATIEAFLAWRTGDAAPEAQWPGRRFPATGPVDAEIMILIDSPERDDADVLMAGAAGRLFDRMLAAIGRSRESVHLVPVCTVRPAAGRIASDVEARLAEIARHHAALVRPQRLLAMGNAASRAILGAEMTQARGGLRPLNHQGAIVTGVVASFHPRFLIEKPMCKADAWKDLQMLVAGLKS